MHHDNPERMLTPREAAARAVELMRDRNDALETAQEAAEKAVLSEPLFAPDDHPAHARHGAAEDDFNFARIELRGATRAQEEFLENYGDVLGEAAVAREAELAK